MSVLLAAAMLLIGAGGYISCSLKEEKESQRRSQRPKDSRYKAACTGGPLLLGGPEGFTFKKTDHTGSEGGLSLLGTGTSYSRASNRNDMAGPELLCRGAFEAKRKTA